VMPGWATRGPGMSTLHEMLSHWPAGRRILAAALLALAVGLTVATVLGGLSPSYPVRLVQTAAVAVTAMGALALIASLITSRMADYREPTDEAEFERLVRRSEALAREDLAVEPEEAELTGLDPYDPEDFRLLVREALDDLPDLLLRALRHVAVVVSDQGRRHHAYGLYQSRPSEGGAPDDRPGSIFIFRDTLLRDFGHDADALRDQVTRTVRHELAHHLGADELGVRELGL
jgi:predicted Zn-dependent protease with MMP-like domain